LIPTRSKRQLAALAAFWLAFSEFGGGAPAFGQTPSAQAPPNGSSVDITMLKAGRAFFEQKRFAEALIAFGKFRDQRPNNLAVHFWLATTLAALGRDKEAIPEYTSCLNLSASIGMDSSEMRSNLGNALVRAGYVKEPLFDFKRACQIDSRCPPPYLALAAALIDAGNFDEALNALDAYKKSGGLDIAALFLHGLALAAKDQYEPARKDLTSFLTAASEQSNLQKSGGSPAAPDQGLSSAQIKYVTAGSITPSAIELATRILNQLPPD
jgi:tetratricopeptide (TPR) repeat protein